MLVVLVVRLEPTFTVLTPPPLPTEMAWVPVPPKVTVPVLVPVAMFTSPFTLLFKLIPPVVLLMATAPVPAANVKAPFDVVNILSESLV